MDDVERQIHTEPEWDIELHKHYENNAKTVAGKVMTSGIHSYDYFYSFIITSTANEGYVTTKDKRKEENSTYLRYSFETRRAS